MKIKIICLASIAFLTLPVFAHEGGKNDAVKQRMQRMRKPLQRPSRALLRPRPEAPWGSGRSFLLSSRSAG